MIDERAFIARVEEADPAELAEIIRVADAEQAQALRAYFGPERYRRLQELALRREAVRGMAAAPLGNVVVIPGLMGSELTTIDRGGDRDTVWLSYWHILLGRLERLRLTPDGRRELDPEYTASPSGILKKYYGVLLLTLAERWNVRAYWYDWRKDIELAADGLSEAIRQWFGDQPVHLVAHSMGGLVARAFARKHADRWGRGGRLVMLGTPNHGAFLIPQALTGLAETVTAIEWLDRRHDMPGILRIVNSFPGPYQMLPSTRILPTMAPLYQATTYPGLGVSPAHLERALAFHDWLADVIDPERMAHIAGYNQPTVTGLKDPRQVTALDDYNVTRAGDGSVPLSLGPLRDASGQMAVPTYFVAEEHTRLTENREVLANVEAMLRTGRFLAGGVPPRGVAPVVPREAMATPPEADDPEVHQIYLERRKAALRRIAGLVRRARLQFEAEGPPPVITAAERELEDALTAGFLGRLPIDLAPAPARARPDGRRGMAGATGEPERPQLDITLLHGDITRVHEAKLPGGPVDAVAVGHYIGMPPQNAELALDRAISTAVVGRDASGAGNTADAGLILTEYTQRGLILGELGRCFFLPDPRDDGRACRVIAIAGMGLPGRCGLAELTVLARELAWALGRMGRRHLATVLIGSGEGNLDARAAAAAWVEGLGRTRLANGMTGGGVERVTFVERDQAKLREMVEAFAEAAAAVEEWLDVNVATADVNLTGADDRGEAGPGAPARPVGPAGPVPTRITVSLDGRTYRYGAITETAAIPERAISLDPALVREAARELVAEWDPALQYERGRFLAELLLPDDLQAVLRPGVPLVLMLDATTARVPWEMLAPPPMPGLPALGADPRTSPGRSVVGRGYLGLDYGLTRQLRTTFAPPPEPPPPPRRTLRVLVVADPAADARLPGAEQEGLAVAGLFEAFNAAYGNESGDAVEVTRLIGPTQATRTNVLRHLMLHGYDVLHIAGHCVYDPADPSASGWIFTGGARISAHELRRIDAIPKFIVANCCESGVTPDRTEGYTPALAPSFAEAFFERGVSNFLCTAWPIDDQAALVFALELYRHLLGLRPLADTGPGAYEPTYRPEPLHDALRAARRAVADDPALPGGATTWGAYQHYGNPLFALFDRPSFERLAAAAEQDLVRPARTAAPAAPAPKRRRSSRARKGRKA